MTHVFATPDGCLRAYAILGGRGQQQGWSPVHGRVLAAMLDSGATGDALSARGLASTLALPVPTVAHLLADFVRAGIFADVGTMPAAEATPTEEEDC